MPQLIRNEETTFFKEVKKTRIIKTVYCLLLLYRTYQILNCYYFYQGHLLLEEWIFSIIFISLILLLLFRNSWIAALLIALLQLKFDVIFACSTVGSTITVYINFYFAAYYYFNRRFKNSELKNYHLFNLNINNCKYLLAILWSILNLYALEKHLNDTYWINGTAFEVMLCNPFLSPFFQTFRNLYLANSSTYFLICQIASYSFIAAQILLLPFVLIRKVRWLYYISMFGYIIGITVFIDTSFLAHFAWLLFFLLLPQMAFINKKIHIQKSPLQFCKSLPKLNKSFGLVIGIFVIINTPIINKAAEKVIWLFREWDTYRFVDRKLSMIGLGKVNLFNTYQIESGSKWFVIYKKDQNGWTLVPIMDTTGRKLYYGKDWLHTCNHSSDFLWLANTFQYAIGEEKVNYSNSSTPYKLKGPVYERLVRFDFNKYGETPLINYKVCFYSNIKARKTVNPFVAIMDSTILYTCSKKTLNKIE